MRFKETILEFGFDCRARKLSDKTISNYQKQLRYLERYLGAEYGISEVEEVRSLHLKEFLVSMDEKGRKPRYDNENSYTSQIVFPPEPRVSFTIRRQTQRILR